MSTVIAATVTSSYDTYCLKVGLITQAEWNRSPHTGTFDDYARKNGKLTYAQFIQVMPVSISSDGKETYTHPLSTTTNSTSFGFIANMAPILSQLPRPNLGGGQNTMATTSGADWYYANFTAKNVVASNMSSDGNGGLTIIYPNGTTQKTGAGTEQRAQEIIAAWRASTGQAGATNPTDPISISANNLVKQTIATASNITTPLNEKTGMSWPWYIWGIVIVVGFFVLRLIYRKLFKRRRR